jgi:hypothetical protein
VGEVREGDKKSAIFSEKDLNNFVPMAICAYRYDYLSGPERFDLHVAPSGHSNALN